MSKPVCEEGDVTVLWNQLVHTDREVTANRPDIIPLVQEKHQEEMPVTETSISHNNNNNNNNKGSMGMGEVVPL